MKTFILYQVRYFYLDAIYFQVVLKILIKLLTTTSLTTTLFSTLVNNQPIRLLTGIGLQEMLAQRRLLRQLLLLIKMTESSKYLCLFLNKQISLKKKLTFARELEVHLRDFQKPNTSQQEKSRSQKIWLSSHFFMSKTSISQAFHSRTLLKAKRRMSSLSHFLEVLVASL